MNINSLHVQIMNLSRYLQATGQISCFQHTEEKLILSQPDNTIVEFNVSVAKKANQQWTIAVNSQFKAPFSTPIAQICSNKAGIYIRSESGDVYSKGIDIFKHGVLGVGDNFIISHMTRINLPERAKSFAVSNKHGVALTGEITRQGKAFHMGNSEWLRRQHASERPLPTPTTSAPPTGRLIL
jgi:hypothetical protein